MPFVDVLGSVADPLRNNLLQRNATEYCALLYPVPYPALQHRTAVQYCTPVLHSVPCQIPCQYPVPYQRVSFTPLLTHSFNAKGSVGSFLSKAMPPRLPGVRTPTRRTNKQMAKLLIRVPDTSARVPAYAHGTSSWPYASSPPRPFSWHAV